MKERGTVIEVHPNTLYSVDFGEGRILKCYPSGKIRINHINIQIGDRVEVIIDKFGGKATNRIVRRL